MLAEANLWNSAKDIPAQREKLLKVFEGVWGDFLQKVPPQKEKSKTKEELLQKLPLKKRQLFAFKVGSVLLKEVVIGAHVFQLAPPTLAHGSAVKIVDLRTAHRKQKRGVR